jgi:hypothetical protein
VPFLVERYKVGQDVKLTSHLHGVPRLRTSISIHPVSYRLSWREKRKITFVSTCYLPYLPCILDSVLNVRVYTIGIFVCACIYIYAYMCVYNAYMHTYLRTYIHTTHIHAWIHT